jgi:hypothetical protein
MTRPSAWAYSEANKGDLLKWGHRNLLLLARPSLKDIVLHRADGEVALVDLLGSEDATPGVLGERGYVL